jgi:hypothetical protein
MFFSFSIWITLCALRSNRILRRIPYSPLMERLEPDHEPTPCRLQLVAVTFIQAIEQAVKQSQREIHKHPTLWVEAD